MPESFPKKFNNLWNFNNYYLTLHYDEATLLKLTTEDNFMKQKLINYLVGENEMRYFGAEQKIKHYLKNETAE